MPMDRYPAPVPPTNASIAKTREAIIPVRARVRDGQIVSLLDQAGNEMGLPVTATPSVRGIDLPGKSGNFSLSTEGWSVVSSKPMAPKGVRTDIASATGRILQTLPPDCPVSALKLVYGGWYNRNSGKGEAPIPNPIYVRAAIVPVSAIGDESLPAIGIDVTFGGKQRAVLTRGGLLISDAIDCPLAAGSAYYVKTWYSADLPAAPTAPTLTQASTGGVLSNATYNVACTIVYAESGLESQASAATAVTLTGGTATQKITVTAPTAVAGALGYRVWMSDAGGSEPYYDTGLGVVPFERNAVITAQVNTSVKELAEFVIPSTPKAVPYGNSGTRGGTASGGVGSGEGHVYAVDATAMSYGVAVPAATSALSGFGPAAVLGKTFGVHDSWGLVGDSIGNGSYDSGFGGVSGFLARAVTRQFGRVMDPWITPLNGFVDVTQGSETPTDAAGSGMYRRRKLALLATTIVSDHGTNGIGSATDLISKILSIADWALGAGKQYRHTTITPKHSSTDGYVTLANHTQASASYEAARRQVNAWLRDASPAGPVTAEAAFRVASGTQAYNWNPYSGGDGAATVFCPRNVFVVGSESVTVGGVAKAPTTDYSYYNTTTIAGVQYASGVTFGAAPASNAQVVFGYTKPAGFAVMRAGVTVSDTAAAVEVDSTGALNPYGGWWPADAGTLVASRTSTATSSTSLTDSTLALTTDQYRGYTATIVEDTSTPASVGQTRVIAYNTATVLTFGAGFSPTPSVGAKFVINDCATSDGLHPSPRMHIAMAQSIKV